MATAATSTAMTAAGLGTAGAMKTPSLWERIVRERWMYLFILPGALYFLVFEYLPLLGNIIAFQDYSPFLGITGSPFIGLENFRRLFTDADFKLALVNTLQIELLQLAFAFPAPLILALVLNTIISERVKRTMQSKPLVVLQSIWKEMGWGTIIFLAALTKIEVELYEAAVVDGAGGWRRLWHVTLPGIRSVIVLLLILRLGAMLSVGFEQYYLQRGAVGAQVAEVLDTFVFFRGIQGGDWGFAAAVGLVRGLVGTGLIVTANALARRFGEEGVY